MAELKRGPTQNAGIRHLLHNSHSIDGHYTIKNGKLTYHTQGAEHAKAAQQASAAKLGLKVVALNADQTDFVGQVKSVALVDGVKPSTWEIVMAVGSKAAARVIVPAKRR